MDLLSLQYVRKASLLSALALLSSYLKCIEHKAPSSTPLRPLSLQDAGRTFPNSVGTIHQEAGPQASQWG